MTIDNKQSKIVHLKDFDLSKIHETFTIANFERSVSSNTVQKIVNALLDGTMFNHIIRVVKEVDGKYSVLDGQHRLKALEIVHTAYGVKTFDLILELWNKKQERDVYVNINSGKALNSKDFTKALDDGSIEFFREFDDILNHYRSKKAFAYYDALQALVYARTGIFSPIRGEELRLFILAITPEEKEVLRRAIEAVYTEDMSLYNNILGKSPIFKNLVRVGLHNEFDTIELFNIGRVAIQNNKVIKILANQASTRMATRQIYDIMISDIIPNLNNN